MEGISSLMATLLMLIITISLIAICYAFIGGVFTSSVQALEITNIYCNGEVSISIRNSGTESISSLVIEQTQPEYRKETWEGNLGAGLTVTYTTTCPGEGLRQCAYKITSPSGGTARAYVYCSAQHLAPSQPSLPVVTLNSPQNNAILNSVPVIFNCSASDDFALANITLYGNWSGWHANETKVVTGTSNSTTFSKNLSYGTYVWNCLACDSSNNCSFASSNFTFTLTLIDTIPPTYSNAGHNTTLAGTPVKFYILYNDNVALHPNGQWIFSTNNTGTWVNETFSFTGTPQWANMTKILNSTPGLTIGYRWYANDSAGNRNDTPIFTLVTSAPWLAGWSYRKPVTITEKSGTNLNDYQVLIILDTQSLISAGKMRSDCGDIRFTSSDGTTLLSYWIESGCNTTSTKIWVKVPSIPANDNTTVYIYYKNPSATSQSNGTATFIFFDDFENGTTKWTWTRYASGSRGISTTHKESGEYALYIEVWGDYPEQFKPASNFSVTVSKLRFWRYINISRDRYTRITLFATDGTQLGYYYQNELGRVYWYNGTTLIDTGNYAGYGAFIIELEIDTSVGTVKIFRDGTQIYFGNLAVSGKNLGYFEYSLDGTVCIWIDNFIVRKYSSSEPTYSIGAEESF